MHLAWRSARAPMPAAAAWAEVTRIEHELGQARAAAADAARDRDWLAHASAEIEALAPEAGEETRPAPGRPGVPARGQGRRIPGRPRRAARRLGWGACETPARRPADRARSGRPPAARGSSRLARPGADRGVR